MVILFIFTPYQGHFVKTQLLAKYYEDNGYTVHYILGSKPQGYTITNLHIVSHPTSGNSKNHSTNLLKWWHTLRNNFSGTSYENRKNEVLKIVKSVNPERIYLDEFCSSDFIFLYPYRCIVLTPFFPSKMHTKIPPLNVFANPKSNDVTRYWNEALRRFKRKRLLKQIQYLGFDSISTIKRQFRKSDIPNSFLPVFENSKIPKFSGLEKWYLQPVELDFEYQNLNELEKYMGPMIDMGRAEILDSQYQLFLKLANSKKSNKIIFCSLGSVTCELVPDVNKIVIFYNKIISIALKSPELYFLVKIPSQLQSKLKPLSLNIFLMDYPPYYDILERSHLFITHCGGNSYLEAIYKAVPMLCIPIADSWDYNGNAARIIYHGLGMKSSLDCSENQLFFDINFVLYHHQIQNNITRYSDLFNRKYHKKYLTLESFKNQLTDA